MVDILREEFFLNMRLLMTEFYHPNVTLCGWQDIKFQSLTVKL